MRLFTAPIVVGSTLLTATATLGTTVYGLSMPGTNFMGNLFRFDTDSPGTVTNIGTTGIPKTGSNVFSGLEFADTGTLYACDNASSR